MKSPLGMLSRAVVLKRGVKVFGLELQGTWEGASSIRAIHGFQSEKIQGFDSWKCEGCGHLGGVFANSPRTRIRRPANKTIHQISSRSFHTSRPPSKSWHTAPAQPPTTHPDTTVPLPEQLRSIMRLLTHSVVVCTSKQETIPRAMTMSSFTSLTLSPTPLITFNVATPSRTLDAITSSRKFNIHVLAGDPGGARVASHFTRGNVEGHVLDGLDDVVCDADGVLRGKGVLFALRCRVLADAPEGGLVRVRDHIIVIGEVVEMVPVSKAEEFSLIYADRRYRQVGGVLSRDE